MSRVFLIEDDSIIFLDSRTNRATRVVHRSKGGIVSEVIKLGTHKFSNSTANDPLFNNLCDLDSQLPSITYPVIDPEKLNIVAAF